MTEIATQDVARSRAAMIRAGIQNYLHTLAHIAAAYAQRDWKALGYESWDRYVDGEYSEHRLKLSPEHRQKAVAELRLAGMSQRAIGSALGVDQATVIRDLRRGDADASPDEIQGADGKTYASTRPSSPAGQADAHEARSEPDRSGHQPPAATGEAHAGLDREGAGNTVASEAPSSVPLVALDGAGVDAAGSDLGPVETAEAAWPRVVTPAASGGGTDAAGDTPEDDRGLAGAIADAQREARTAPAHLAHKAFETLKVFRDHVTRNCGGVDAICDDLTGVDATTRRQIWLAELDDTAELINAWRDRLRRQYLRRIQ